MDGLSRPITENSYSSPIPDLGRVMTEKLPLLDLNKNGHVCDYEAEFAMKNPLLKGDAAKLVAVLDRMGSEIEQCEQSDNGFQGVTVRDMQKFVAERKDRHPRRPEADEILGGFEIVDAADRRFASIIARTDAAQKGPHKMFTTGDIASVTPEAPVQGMLGDCYFVAALSSLAAANPRSIQKMIAGHKDATYTVTFPGQKPVKVAAPTDQEMGTYAHSSKFGTWPAIIEKAYGYHRIMTNTRDPRNCSDDLNCGADAGSPDYAGLKTLTGLPVKMMDVAATNNSVSDEEVHKALKKAFAEHLPVDAAIDSDLRDATTGDVFDLPTHHEYSVLNYDTARRTLTLRNPWGTGEPADDHGNALDGKDDGIFKMALAQFRRNFDELGLPAR